jgi:hypothetical protein
VAQSQQPLMSFVMVARNDNFHGDYKYRLSTCLNFLTKGLAEIGRTHETEIIVCDWGSETPLHEALELHPAAREQVKYLAVPPELARARQVNGATFGYPIGVNAAVRRAKGEFICELTADVVLNAANLDTLLSLFAGKYPHVPIREAFFPLLRRQLHMCQAKRQPSLRELEDYLNRNLALLPVDGMGCGYGWASGDVMHRDIWHALRGMDETMLYWGWMDIDVCLRMTQRYPIIELGNFGICGVHLQHYFQVPNDPVFRERKNNPPNDRPSFAVNDENWGLNNVDLPMHCGAKVWADEPPDETSRVGTVEPWNLTARQLVEQLTAPELRPKVQNLLGSIRVDIPGPAALSPKETNAFLALAWHASRRGVRTYVEAGMRVPYACCVVTRHSPGAELYMITDWSPTFAGVGSYELLANNLIKGLGQHWGYLRFVGDDPTTAVERISRSAGGRFAVDLALVRCSPQLPAAQQQALELARYLTPGGAIVVAGADEASFRKVWSALNAQHPQLTYLRFSDGLSGIALAATLAG